MLTRRRSMTLDLVSWISPPSQASIHGTVRSILGSVMNHLTHGNRLQHFEVLSSKNVSDFRWTVHFGRTAPHSFSMPMALFSSMPKRSSLNYRQVISRTSLIVHRND